jgi:hypothetical protein
MRDLEFGYYFVYMKNYKVIIAEYCKGDYGENYWEIIGSDESFTTDNFIIISKVELPKTIKGDIIEVNI